MQHVVAQYRGNPGAVKVDPSMIHGMDGMGHGGHAGHGARRGSGGARCRAAGARGWPRATLPGHGCQARQPAVSSASAEQHTGHEGHHH